jgi:hypothetical protein
MAVAEEEEEQGPEEKADDDDPLSFGPDDEAWVKELLQLNISNIANVWAKLHNRKHVSESIIQHRWFLNNFFVPLFSNVLPYAKAKWAKYRSQLTKELAVAKELVKEAADRAADAANPTDQEEATDAQEAAQETAVRLESQIVYNDAIGESFCPVDFVARDNSNDDDPHGAVNIEQVPDDADLTSIFQGAVSDMVGHNLAYKVDVGKLKVDQLRAELGRRGLSVEGLKPALVDRLWAAVDKSFPEASGMNKGDTTLKMNLHRMKQFLFHLIFLWMGKELKWKGGGDLRRRVVELFRSSAVLRDWWQAAVASAAAMDADAARAANAALSAMGGGDYPMSDHAPLPSPAAVWDDDAAIDAACGKSTFIFGLWKLIDTEIRIAVVPFEAWVDGDILPFLQNFPFMVLQVMAAGKPQVQKYMLLQLERMLWYQRKHPDVIRTIALSCAALDEEDIEFFNALLGRFRSARDTSPDINTYIYISGLITGMHDLSKQLDATLSGRRPGAARATQPTEHHRLREIYTSKSWVETNAVVEEWILGLFKKALDGDAEMDASWPEEDRISFGRAHLRRARTSLRSWLARCERDPEYYDEDPDLSTSPTGPLPAASASNEPATNLS